MGIAEMTLTPEKLDEIERLAGLATPGPYSCVNGETITLRAPDGSCLAQMTFLTKRGRRDADEVAKTARMLAALDPATVRELVRAEKERDHQAARIAELGYRVKRALSGDLYALLTDIQNGIDALGHKDMANSAIQRIDALLTILEGDEA